MVLSRIRLLPQELADKIAAGEVVERPASVVKELLENALDAGANRIEISVLGSGLKSILVTDNGRGMDTEDALLALKRHATSKITSETDLFRVSTLGFRGEALPAIASVSRLTLTTRPPRADSGVRIENEAGRMGEVSQVGVPPGTSLEVRDLFFNTPVRLKFLKSARTESSWIKETIVRLGLANPDIFFRLSEEGRTLITLVPVGRHEDRLAEIFGPEMMAELIPIDYDHPAVRVFGWISPPDRQRANSRSIYTFVNRRFVRDRLILGAILGGYQGRLERGRYPTAALFLDLEPGTVDVNVHPAKLEVRFHHAQVIRQAIHRAVSTTLGAEERLLWSVSGREEGAAGIKVAETAAPFGPSGPTEAGARTSGPLPSPTDPDWSPQTPLSPAPEAGAPADLDAGLPAPSSFRYLGRYRGAYLVGQSGEDLILIDQHAAHERIIYQELLASPGQSQPLLLTCQVSLTPLQTETINRHLEQAAYFGLEVEPFGPAGKSFVVKSVPLILAGADPAALVRELADELAGTRPAEPQERLRLSLARVACHTALKAGQELTPEEVDELVQGLAHLPGPLTCPHGRPIIRRLSRSEIDRWFRRR